MFYQAWVFLSSLADGYSVVRMSVALCVSVTQLLDILVVFTFQLLWAMLLWKHLSANLCVDSVNVLPFITCKIIYFYRVRKSKSSQAELFIILVLCPLSPPKLNWLFFFFSFYLQCCYQLILFLSHWPLIGRWSVHTFPKDSSWEPLPATTQVSPLPFIGLSPEQSPFGYVWAWEHTL